MYPLDELNALGHKLGIKCMLARHLKPLHNSDCKNGEYFPEGIVLASFCFSGLWSFKNKEDAAAFIRQRIAGEQN